MEPLVKSSISLKEAMRSINETGLGIVFVVEEGKVVGALSDGDIRRAILSGKSLRAKVAEVTNRELFRVYEHWPQDKVDSYVSSDKLVAKIPRFKALLVPVLDEKDRFLKVLPVNKGVSVGGVASLGELRKPCKVLVIGGAGYVGSVLVRDLVAQGYVVKVLDNLTYTDAGIKDMVDAGEVTLIEGDILNIKSVVESLEDVDAVVHLAAVVGDPSSKLKPKETIEVNYMATKAIADACKYLGIPRMIFASTCSVYGFNEDVVDEQSSPNPLSLYAETKLKSEVAILEAADEMFAPTILRLSTVYGLSPRMRFDLVVNLLTAKAATTGKITVYGRGFQKRPLIHVKDVSRAVIHVLESPIKEVGGQVFNVGSRDQNLTIREVAELIKGELPGADIVFIKEKEDDRSYEVSFSKLSKTGFRTEFSIVDAVVDIVHAINSGSIGDYQDAKYSNYNFLKNTVS